MWRCLRMQMKAVTVLGAFLDPVADKIMVTAALVLLAVSPPEPLSHADLAVPVVIMIGREIAMSSLREWAAACGGTAHRVSHLSPSLSDSAPAGGSVDLAAQCVAAIGA